MKKRKIVLLHVIKSNCGAFVDRHMKLVEKMPSHGPLGSFVTTLQLCVVEGKKGRVRPKQGRKKDSIG